MPKRASDDASSIGNILLSMGVITEAQLEVVLAEQQRLRADQLLGKLLVASGVISPTQLEEAMKMQLAMRSKKAAAAAIATADLAIARHRRQSVVALRRRIEQHSAALTAATRRITGDAHPMITEGMLAEGKK